MNVRDCFGDVDGSRGGVIHNLDGDEGDIAGQLVDELECFLDIGLLGFHLITIVLRIIIISLCLLFVIFTW